MTNAWIGHSIEGAFIYSFGGAKESSAAAGDSLDMPDVSRYVFRVSLSIVLAFAFVGAARAGLKEGLEAVASKDYERAYRELLPLAEEGNPLAEAELGRLYGIGKGVPQNDALAAEWLERAAQKGEASAQVNLATMFRAGVGVRRDYGEALSWYRRAADQGSAQGCIGIADMYVRGLGVGVDLGVAIYWLEKAAAL